MHFDFRITVKSVVCQVINYARRVCVLTGRDNHVTKVLVVSSPGPQISKLSEAFHPATLFLDMIVC